MKGYSFRSLTDLVLKIFKTKVNAGTGLSGGGSLEADRTLTVNYGTTAGTATQGNDSRVVNAASNATVNAKEAALEAKKADKVITITAGTGLSGGGTLAANRTLTVNYGTAAGTAAQGNDSRLSNSREWTAGTISQAEAEAGTATTRRAFTAQRVRQATTSWFNGISGALGRTILTRTTAAQVRGDIGLGTAATRDVGENAGQVMEVGAFGLGGTTPNPQQDFISVPEKGRPVDRQLTTFFQSNADKLPEIWGVAEHTGGWVINRGSRPIAFFFGNKAELKMSYGSSSGWTSPKEFHHTGNIQQTTGSSTEFPMSQKATTDQLATKANNSTQVIAGKGLTGGGSLSTNRTLNVSYGTTSGTSVQGNDSRVVNALQRGSNLSDISNKTTARSNLDLGTAATRDVGTDHQQLLAIGSNGYGGTSSIHVGDWNEATRNGVYYQSLAGLNAPIGGWLLGRCQHHNDIHATQTVETFNQGKTPRTFKRQLNGGVWREWVELHHTGNLLQSTGSSAEFPMSQKATTDALNTKAASSHTHPWSQVTGQPATATRWPKLSEVTDRPTNYPTTWDSVAAKPAQATRWPTFAEVTGKPANYPTTWNSVAAKPAQATRWPTFTEVTDKPANYPTNWATVANKPIVQTVGTSITNLMSQKAITDALGQPSMTGSAALNGTTDNTVQLTDIVTTLGLEVGDVIRIQYSGYDKLHTVESITDDNSIVVNYEHAGNRGDGSLKLADETATVTITRIAKWYNAPIGLGQAWVYVSDFRTAPVNNWGATYFNTTGRAIEVSLVSTHAGSSVQAGCFIMVDGGALAGGIGSQIGGFAGDYYGVTATVPFNSNYQFQSQAADTGFFVRELR